jgi:hypothetical protein
MNNHAPTLGATGITIHQKMRSQRDIPISLLLRPSQIIPELCLQHTLGLNPMAHEEKEKEGKGYHQPPQSQLILTSIVRRTASD